MLFNYPTPKRMADRLPGIALNWCSTMKQCDNIGVAPIMFPDGKTFVWTTDSSTMLQFNPDDLSVKGWYAFEAGDYQHPGGGATHMVPDLNNGDLIGAMTESIVSMHGMDS